METILKLEHAQLITLIATLLPGPLHQRITSCLEQDRLANPHNDNYKQKRRSEQEIIVQLRVEQAMSIVDEVYKQVNVRSKASFGRECA